MTTPPEDSAATERLEASQAPGEEGMGVSRREFLSAAGAVLAAPAIQRQEPETFDFVIVGAGSSGCVVANRLTAHPQLRVLLLEAGGPDTAPAIHSPGAWVSLLGSELDWNYRTEPEPGLMNRQIAFPRGRTYGGSSAINAMSYVRGHRLDYEGWNEVAGDEWGFAAVLPYFLRSEDNTRGPSDYHNAGGLLRVADTTDPHRGHDAFLAAAQELGFAARPDWDFNGAQQEGGAGFYQKNIRDGRRESTATAFLTPFLSRPNLTTRPESQVLRLLFDGSRVSGVEYARHGRMERVRVDREVVLAAGVVESPKILMLSGIGPAEVLKRLGIPVTLDLREVGANLHDRPRVGIRWAGTTELAPSSVSAGLFTHSGRRSGSGAPDVHFYVGRGLDEPDPFITITVAIGSPESRGSIVLRSQDPTAPPLIRVNYLDESRDLETLAEGMRLARALGETEAYAALRGAPLEPGAGIRTPDEVRAFLRRSADTMFHPVGTCRMGTDGGAVVDPQLRVRGIQGLRVADASIMPAVVNAPTNAACVMIGEKAADLIVHSS